MLSWSAVADNVVTDQEENNEKYCLKKEGFVVDEFQ